MIRVVVLGKKHSGICVNHRLNRVGSLCYPERVIERTGYESIVGRQSALERAYSYPRYSIQRSADAPSIACNAIDTRFGPTLGLDRTPGGIPASYRYRAIDGRKTRADAYVGGSLVEECSGQGVVRKNDWCERAVCPLERGAGPSICLCFHVVSSKHGDDYCDCNGDCD